MSRTSRLVALAAAAAFALTACSSGSSGSTSSTTTPAATSSAATASPSATPTLELPELKQVTNKSNLLERGALGVAVGNVMSDKPEGYAKREQYLQPLKDSIFCGISGQLGSGTISRFSVVAGDTAYKGANVIDATGMMNVDFRDYDVAFDAAEQCGSWPFVVVTGRIAQLPSCKVNGPEISCPTKHDDMVYGYGMAAGAHYKGRVAGLAWGNEQNFNSNNPGGGVNPALEAHDARLFAKGVHVTDPSAVVGFGSVGPASSENGVNMLDYTEAALKAGLGKDISFLGVNIACYPQKMSLDCQNVKDAVGPKGIYDRVTKAGYKLVVTEMTGGPDLTPTEQADTLVDGYLLLMQGEYPKLGAILWYEWNDSDDASGLATHPEILETYKVLQAATGQAA